MGTASPLHGLVRYPQLHDRDWLVEQFIMRRRTKAEIARELGCSYGAAQHAIASLKLDPAQFGHQFYRCPYCRGTGRLER